MVGCHVPKTPMLSGFRCLDTNVSAVVGREVAVVAPVGAVWIIVVVGDAHTISTSTRFAKQASKCRLKSDHRRVTLVSPQPPIQRRGHTASTSRHQVGTGRSFVCSIFSKNAYGAWKRSAGIPANKSDSSLDESNLGIWEDAGMPDFCIGSRRKQKHRYFRHALGGFLNKEFLCVVIGRDCTICALPSNPASAHYPRWSNTWEAYCSRRLQQHQW